MEKKSKALHLNDDQKLLASEQHLRPSNRDIHLEDLGQQFQQINAEVNLQIKYYQQYKKIYFTSYKLWCEIGKQNKIKQSLSSRVSAIETQLANLHKTRKNDDEQDYPEEGEKDSKKKNNKRMRRTAQEIERKYVCTADFCDRCYGSEGSLQQHIKLKHPQLYNKSVQSEQF